MHEGRILIAEDDKSIQSLLKTQLTHLGFAVHVVSNGLKVFDAIVEFGPNVVLMDINLPGMGGLEICRSIRPWFNGALLFIAATDAPQAKIMALESGADDYVTKPFHLGELVARIEAVRRRSGEAPYEPVMALGSLTLDSNQHAVYRDGEEIHLTKIEYLLLSELLRHRDRVLTYDHLLTAVWGPGYDDTRTVHVHVSNLRRKIEGIDGSRRLLQAVPGVGYRLKADVEETVSDSRSRLPIS
jgi:DNA-binding response OmpR family regulator